MYDAINSQYTYKGTDILKNKLNIKDEELLNQAREIAENKDVFNTIIKDVFE